MDVCNHKNIKVSQEKSKPRIYGKVVGKSNERLYVMKTLLGFVRRNRKHIQKVKLESQIPMTISK